MIYHNVIVYCIIPHYYDILYSILYYVIVELAGLASGWLKSPESSCIWLRMSAPARAKSKKVGAFYPTLGPPKRLVLKQKHVFTNVCLKEAFGSLTVMLTVYLTTRR